MVGWKFPQKKLQQAFGELKIKIILIEIFCDLSA